MVAIMMMMLMTKTDALGRMVFVYLRVRLY